LAQQADNLLEKIALDGEMATLGEKVKRKSQLEWHEIDGDSDDVTDGAFLLCIDIGPKRNDKKHRGVSISSWRLSPIVFLFRGFPAKKIFLARL